MPPLPKASPTPVRRRRKDARPHELAVAALELFAERGYAATRLEDVAARAGVAKATVYLYFANKRALFDGVLREAIVPLLAKSERRVGRFSGATGDLLRETLTDWSQLLQATPLSRVPKLMVMDADKFPELASSFHDAVIARARDVVGRVLRRGIKRREFRIDDLNMTVEILMAAMMMPAIARHSPGFYAGDAPDPSEYLDALIAMTLKGITSTPPSRSTTVSARKKRKPR